MVRKSTALIRGESYELNGIIASSRIDGVMELGGVPILIEWRLAGTAVVVGLAAAMMKAEVGAVRVSGMEKVEMGDNSGILESKTRR